MPLSPYIRDLRERIGTDLLLLPSVAVLPFDDAGRLLLVRQIDGGRWGTIGGAVEVDEAPSAAAAREAREEAGIEIELQDILGVVGGPDFRITYPHGDRTAYVSTLYRARVTGGTPTPDGEETSAVGWFELAELSGLPDLGDFARHALSAVGLLDTPAPPGASETPTRTGPPPQVSTQGPQRQLDQQSPPHLWGRLWAHMLALPAVEEAHSQVSPASSRALRLIRTTGPTDPRRTLAPGGWPEPVHLHGVEDTSLHLVLPEERGRQLVDAGWALPHQYGDEGTEFFVYGPRTEAELTFVLGVVRESLSFAGDRHE